MVAAAGWARLVWSQHLPSRLLLLLHLRLLLLLLFWRRPLPRLQCALLLRLLVVLIASCRRPGPACGGLGDQEAQPL